VLSKQRSFALFLSGIMAAGITAPIHSQTTAPALSTPSGAAAGQASPVGQGILRGHVSDPTGALIPGATVGVTTVAGAPVGTATSDAAGAYVVRGLAAGRYVVQVTFEGFATYVSSPIPLDAGQAKNFDVKMTVEGSTQEVDVTDAGGPQVSTEAGDNASAIVLKGSDLDALSDDPDELQNELSALAGPAAGPNGGQIYIDGFTSGELPPKSAIREIRINSNPFSAEFDKLGYGRIEILTKPGTDKLHGRASVQGNDNAFNTGNPFAGTLPSYHSIQSDGTISGAIKKSASFFLSIQDRALQSASVYDAQTPASIACPGTYVASTGVCSGGFFSPSSHVNISPRFDLQFGQKNTVTVRYQFFDNSSTGLGGGGGFGGGGGSNYTLPSEATHSSSIEHTIQISDSEIINDHIVNETRFQYLLDLSNSNPAQASSLLLPQISVPGYFSTGGPTSQTSTDNTQHFELQNITTMTKGAQAIKFGTRLRDNRDNNTSTSNFNGTFTFASLTAFANGTPEKLSYDTGRTNQIANVFDAALFFQDDWKYNRFLTLSGGLRWEGQNHIADHSDWGPRVAFAYALDGHKKGGVSKTVLRGGYGFFFDRLGLGSVMSLERFNGKAGSEQQNVINNPTCYTPNGLVNPSTTCGGGTTSTTYDTIYSKYKSPVHEQFGASLERQITKTITGTATFLHTYGVHQSGTIDANAYLPNTGTVYYNATTGPHPGVRPNANFGPIDENFPEAIYKQNQAIVSVNARVSSKLSLTGNAAFNWANSNTGSFSNSYDPILDYGPASFTGRRSVYLMATYTGPWKIAFNPFLIAQSGKPFGIATGTDLTGDNFIGQDRPSYATAAEIAAATANPAANTNIVTTSYGVFNVTPLPGETIIPANLGRGPAAMVVNLRMSRTWGIGPEVGATSAQQRAGGGGAGGPGGGGPPGGGMGGGGFGGGGGRGGGGFGGGGGGGARGGLGGTGRKYTLNFSAQALNLFNNIDLGTPVGTVTPGANDRFGTFTSLAGGIFSTSSSARRIFIQAAFQF
jgi:hypothetical protein